MPKKVIFRNRQLRNYLGIQPNLAQIKEIYSLIFWQKFHESLQKSWFHRKNIRWDMRVFHNCAKVWSYLAALVRRSGLRELHSRPFYLAWRATIRKPTSLFLASYRGKGRLSITLRRELWPLLFGLFHSISQT